MRAFADLIDRFNVVTGKSLAWFALIIVLIQFAVVLMRYVFGIGSIFMQELIVYLHAFLFMLASAYTLAHDGHVRVDIFYREAQPRTKAKINMFGAAFLMIPVCILIIYVSWDYVYNSWAIMEGSQETSGIQARFLLKSAIIGFSVQMALQGFVMMVRSWYALQGDEVELQRLRVTE
ncbi:TRAP transporter small permease subunit [Cohaesibacter gelatinilyticus]|uniref:TRAP transporter small permease protein n=1 Tax=Cohaesibacter gelatinilyticus TaxID=372072 RepID=A0A285PB84_9HYPH|nr:TRAP transporter small permease subunit [Cohaesibacter gelatinilyticus]SNZ18984.1 TRAP-type mannitol/chloroaromatic compound transport system, small permease component [Cohaesibacter gelatinilyticus]HAT86406.1 C4-dicarboxylate ABC transporter permease [Hyphomicrobiales bacterium]